MEHDAAARDEQVTSGRNDENRAQKLHGRQWLGEGELKLELVCHAPAYEKPCMERVTMEYLSRGGGAQLEPTPPPAYL